MERKLRNRRTLQRYSILFPAMSDSNMAEVQTCELEVTSNLHLVGLSQKYYVITRTGKKLIRC